MFIGHCVVDKIDHRSYRQFRKVNNTTRQYNCSHNKRPDNMGPDIDLVSFSFRKQQNVHIKFVYYVDTIWSYFIIFLLPIINSRARNVLIYLTKLLTDFSVCSINRKGKPIQWKSCQKTKFIVIIDKCAKTTTCFTELFRRGIKLFHS